jgi:hypothetical protein
MEDKCQAFDHSKWNSTFPKIEKSIPTLTVQTLNDSFNNLECSDSFGMNMSCLLNHEKEPLQVTKLDTRSRENVSTGTNYMGGMKFEKGPEVSVVIIEAPETKKIPSFNSHSKIKGIGRSSISELIKNTASRPSKSFRKKAIRSKSLKAIKTEYSDNFIDTISGTTSVQHSGCPTPRRHTLTPVSNVSPFPVAQHDVSGLEIVPEEQS